MSDVIMTTTPPTLIEPVGDGNFPNHFNGRKKSGVVSVGGGIRGLRHLTRPATYR